MEKDMMNLADFIFNETFSSQRSTVSNDTKENNLLLNGWSDDEAYFVEAQLPGLVEESIDISVTGKELSIKAIMDENTLTDRNYIIKERPTGQNSADVKIATAGWNGNTGRE